MNISSTESTFSKPKLIKNYLRNSTFHTYRIDVDSIIGDFVNIKARKNIFSK